MWKSSPSGVLTYFAFSGSSSRSFRAWKPTTRPARVGEREEQPAAEVVAAAPADETGGAELGRGEALLLRLARERGRERREPEPELAAGLLAEPAPGQVLARRRAGVRVPEVALVERGGLLEQRVEPVAPLPVGVGLRRGLVVLERDVEALGEELDGADEVELLGLAHERDRVAARAAAEAVVDALLGVDREARRPLLVERAAPRVAAADLAQRRAQRDDVDDARGLLDRLDGRVLDPRHYASPSA